MYRQLLFIILMLLTSTAFTQVIEKQMNMSSGEHSGLEVDLPVDSKSADKIWKEYVKPYGKTDWDRKNKEQVLFNVHISSITSSPLTVVARFNQFRDMTKGSFWFKKEGEFLSSDTDTESLRAAGEFLQEYAYETERHAIREELKKHDKGLNSLEKDLGKLQKKNQNLHKDIEKAKAEIAKKEREIAENLDFQSGKRKDIEIQKEKIQKTTIKLTNVGKSS